MANTGSLVKVLVTISTINRTGIENDILSAVSAMGGVIGSHSVAPDNEKAVVRLVMSVPEERLNRILKTIEQVDGVITVKAGNCGIRILC